MKTFISTLLLCPFLANCATPSKSELDEEVKQLCSVDGGIKVYEMVKMPAAKFDQYGNINIPINEYSKPADEYYIKWDVTHLVKGNPELSRSHFKLIRRSDGKLLGEAIYYGRRGGDLPGPWHDSSFSCPAITSESSLEKSIFVKGE